MPTGGGKSLCFQVPTMAQDGLCLVISPLIALMRDQVQNLRRRDIKATAIYMGMTRDEISIALDNCRFGNYKFLYVSPERLQSVVFREQLATLPVCMIAVDEAHCISQWGYDFRPSYLNIAEVRQLLPGIPVLALTATATPDVIDDIQERLGFSEKNVFKQSFARENLGYIVINTDDKPQRLLRILNRTQGSSIVYVRNRQKTKLIADFLVENGISATFYHAGLLPAERAARQQQWAEYRQVDRGGLQNGKPEGRLTGVRVMVATNAFGMGIDKPDVRTVIHIDMPDCIESYFQEAGRAGRDGKTAYAVMLYNKDDKRVARKRVSDNYPQREFITRVYADLADWLIVGEGSGLNRTFKLPLQEFCADRHLPMLPTYSALHLLTQAGYISFSDEQETQPRVMMLCTREELYGLPLSQDEEHLLNIILRRYEGIFTEPQYLHETIVAQQASITTEQLNSTLISLAQRRLLLYIPRNKTPLVTYTREREDTERVYIPDSIYVSLRDRYIRRLQAMIEYAEQTSYCRSQVLLAYFGETDALPCGHCDVCRQVKSER
ncbi:MAG: RecQ family ATP-dependent DNA helicase [Paludibacteraceae bacterium]|nr:RecQ family ATP-dependent DNA helicase [Paludibacteraceae bacterium]